jgi:CheY-specific phosphatase CheX
MFSVSSPTCSADSARAALENALTRVAEDCFYAMVEPAAADWRAQWSRQVDWVQAKVSFHGAGDGAVVCRMPRTLARELSASFLGMSEEDVQGAVVINDLTGELTNMVCGCWLTRAFPSQLFQLDPPSIAFAAEPPPADWLIITLNGSPLGISLSIKGS